MIKFQCERCRATIQAPETIAGKHVACPTCQHRNTVPRTERKKPVPKVVWAAGAVIVLAAALVWAFWSSGSSDGSNTSSEDGEGVVKKADEEATVDRWEVKQSKEAKVLEDERGRRTDQAAEHSLKQKEDFERAEKKRKEQEDRDRLMHERREKAEEYMRERARKEEEERKKRGETKSVNPIVD